MCRGILVKAKSSYFNIVGYLYSKLSLKLYNFNTCSKKIQIISKFLMQRKNLASKTILVIQGGHQGQGKVSAKICFGYYWAALWSLI